MITKVTIMNRKLKSHITNNNVSCHQLEKILFLNVIKYEEKEIFQKEVNKVWFETMGKSYELYVQKGQPFYKVITNILFSHVGLLVLVLAYAFAGYNEYLYKFIG